MQGLTKRQREIIDYIEAYTNEKRYAPSFRELKEHFGFSSIGSVFNHIRVLKRKGLISHDTKGARSLSLSKKGNEGIVEIPLIGKIKEGKPIETFDHFQMFTFPSHLVAKDKECYLLQVEGNGLQEELIADKDLLVVEPRSPKHGEMVIVLINEEAAYVKKYFNQSPFIRLESATDLHPITLRENHVSVKGVVISLFRHY